MASCITPVIPPNQFPAFSPLAVISECIRGSKEKPSAILPLSLARHARHGGCRLPRQGAYNASLFTPTISFFSIPTPASPVPLCKTPPLSFSLSPGSGVWGFSAIWRLWIPPDLPPDQSLSYTLICHLKACLETPALFHSSLLFLLALLSFRAAPVFYPLGICFRGSSRPLSG